MTPPIASSTPKCSAFVALGATSEQFFGMSGVEMGRTVPR